jgi:hypothetical protein
MEDPNSYLNLNELSIFAAVKLPAIGIGKHAGLII